MLLRRRRADYAILLLIVQTFTINLEPTPVTVLRNEFPGFLRCSPVDDVEYKIYRLPRKQGDTIPVRATGLERSDHGIPSSFFLDSTYQGNILVNHIRGAWESSDLRVPLTVRVSTRPGLIARNV